MVDEPAPGEYTTPPGTLGPAGLQGLQHITEDQWRARVRAAVTGQATGAQAGFAKGLREQVLAPLADVFRGVTRPGFEQVARAFHDGQQALKDRLDLLSPLLDYGSAYMDTTGGLLDPGANSGVMPFVRQIGPMRGCELHNGGIRLLDAGLWDIRAQLHFGRIHVGSGRVEWRITVHDEAGGVFSEQRSAHDTAYAHTQTIVSSVVVPRAGFTVMVEVYWIQAFRELAGGPQNTRLTVQHFSRTTGVGDTGAMPDGGGGVES